MTTNDGIASPTYRQLTADIWRIIMQPTWNAVSFCLESDRGMSPLAGISYQDKSAARGPGRDRGKYRGKEDRDQKAAPGHHGRESSAPSLSNPSTALDERSDGRAAEQRRQRYAAGVGAVRECGPRKVPILRVDHSAESHHRVQSCGGIDNVHVEKGEEREDKLRAVLREVPVELPQCVSDGAEVDHLLEEIETRVALVGVGEIRDGGAAAGNY